jgi:hypothetical protein
MIIIKKITETAIALRITLFSNLAKHTHTHTHTHNSHSAACSMRGILHELQDPSYDMLWFVETFSKLFLKNSSYLTSWNEEKSQTLPYFLSLQCIFKVLCLFPIISHLFFNEKSSFYSIMISATRISIKNYAIYDRKFHANINFF